MSYIEDIPESCLAGYDYANAVALGEIPVCKLVKSAIGRFFHDMKRASTTDWPYYMDWEAVDKVIKFVELMPHIKGPEAGHRIQLAPWQKFIILNVFGWKRKVDGHRRFRKVYAEVPRGNGKSTLVAPIALYMLAADGEGGAEIYSAAVSRDQARIVFDAAKAMAQKKKHFLNKAGVYTYSHTVSKDDTNSVFKSLSSDASSLDGLNVHFAVLDEVARHKSREVHDVIETATGKRNQPLMWMITTAGPDQGGIGFEVHDYGQKLLEGVIQDDTFFSIIYATDPGDDWTVEETWRKANPNWGLSVVPDTIAQLASRAVQVPSFQNTFRMKHLNEWTNANIAWMDSMAWSRQASPAEEDDFLGNECIMGLDLASKIDIAARILVFRRPNDLDVSAKHPYIYHIIPKLYLPEEAVKKNRGHASYEGWALGGHMIMTPGDVIDFELIEEDIEEDCKRYDVKEIAFDPWQSMQLAQRLLGKGIPMVEFPATVRNFSEPTKEFEALVRQGLMFHNNNPAFNWMISNLVVKEDRKGNIFPRKEREQNKIDGPVAAIMALARWTLKVQENQFDVAGVIG